jgi:NADP-dependent 3-hydroxy acid dehydrogenase YdfG
MKYAITGHTSGIGQALFSHLSPAAIGFSLTTGYDIRDRADRIRIINESEDCDVFINNAPAGFGQTELFLELFEHWKHKDKTIINVGSRIAEIAALPVSHQFLLGYQAEKLILKEMSSRAQGAKCKVNYRWFAYVGTERILKKYPEFTEKDYISVDNAVEIILS